MSNSLWCVRMLAARSAIIYVDGQINIVYEKSMANNDSHYCISLQVVAKWPWLHLAGICKPIQ